MAEIGTALVTGATGFLGGALARRLAADGVHVKALARRPNRDRYIAGIDGIEVVTGDVTDADRMREVAQGCNVVFHVAAAMGGNMRLQRAVNVEGTRSVMCAAASAGVNRVVTVSSIATYGFRHEGIITEDTPLQPRKDPYNVTKAAAEAVVREIGAASSIAYTIIRPGMIYGPRSSMWTRVMFRLATATRTIFIGDGSGSTFPIYVDDVVDLLVTAAAHPKAVNEAFNCTPDPSPTWREFLGAYARLADHEMRWMGIPPSLACGAAPLIEGLLTLRGEPKDVPDMIPYTMRKTTYSMAKARDLLGWSPKVDLQSGVERCAPYLREKGLLA